MPKPEKTNMVSLNASNLAGPIPWQRGYHYVGEGNAEAGAVIKFCVGLGKTPNTDIEIDGRIRNNMEMQSHISV